MSEPIRTEIQPEATAAAEPTTEPTQDGRPEWLPEQFKTGEDLANAYAELRTKMDSGESTDPAPVVESNEGEVQPLYTPEELESWTNTFTETGEVPQEVYDKYAAKGISKTEVDMFIRGKQAEMNDTQATFLETAGGEDAYNQQIQWAAENWSAEDIEAFNQTLNDGNFEQVKTALTGLRDAYTQANPPSPITQFGESGAGTLGYATQAEMLSAMKDKRYWDDAAYRQEVEKKIAHSRF